MVPIFRLDSRISAWALLLLLFLLTSCDRLESTTLAVITPDLATTTPSPEITVTVEPFTGDCVFVFSNRSLPDVSVALNEAFQAAGYPEVEAEAAAYGENCLDANTNTVVRFTAMQTDVYVQVNVVDAADGQAMGSWVERTLRVLGDLPAGTLPGPNPGYVGMTFQSPQSSANLWFPRSQAEGLLEDGVRGNALFQALRGP